MIKKVLLATAVALISVSAAQAEPSNNHKDKADKAQDRGDRARDSGRHREAIDHYVDRNNEAMNAIDAARAESRGESHREPRERGDKN